MLYLNSIEANLSSRLLNNLTLTSVVFEFFTTPIYLKHAHLTLTSVVFELKIGIGLPS